MQLDLIDSISKMTASGKRLELPAGDFFTNYAQVKRCLIDAGGKYKRNGFEFNDDAQEVKDRLCGGEAINDKKKFQFFATPEHLAIRLVDLAEVTSDCKVLEPSAGQGAISNLAKKIAQEVVVVELMPENCKGLSRQGYDVNEACFLSITPKDFGTFDKVIANPPFTKNQDIEHIKHMFNFLKSGGKLVSVASTSWIRGNQKKQQAFRKWLEEVGGTVTDIPAGEFKQSGTNVASVIVEITRA